MIPLNILLAFCLFGCMKERPASMVNDGYIEQQYLEQYQRFIFEGKRRGVDLSQIKVQITTNNYDTAPGRCYIKNRIVHINLKMVEEISKEYGNWYFDFVINHELGHCLLQLDHSDGMMTEYFPYSFANNYWNMRTELLDKMFRSKIINPRAQ